MDHPSPLGESLPMPASAPTRRLPPHRDARSPNQVNALTAIGYRIDLRAPAPTAKDFSRLRTLWTAYGIVCALVAALSLRGMFAIMDGRAASDFASLGYILGSAASIATSGLVLAYAAASLGLAKHSDFKTRAIELARKKHPDFEAYIAEVAAQGRELNAIEASAFIAEAGLHLGHEDLAALDALEQRAAIAVLQSQRASPPRAQASRESLGISERLNESSRELLASLASLPTPPPPDGEGFPSDPFPPTAPSHDRR